MRFLIVDDSATMRRIMANSLAKLGYTDVVQAEDGLDALTKFDASFTMVITDWNMPRLGGTALAAALRARPDGRAVPILMVTARSERDDIVDALASGVNNYIVKPFTATVLKEKIDGLLPAGAV